MLLSETFYAQVCRWFNTKQQTASTVKLYIHPSRNSYATCSYIHIQIVWFSCMWYNSPTRA